MDPAGVCENLFALSGKKVDETLKNKKLTASLLEIAKEAGTDSCSKAAGAVLYSVATKYPKKASLANRPLLVKYVVEEKITAGAKIAAALRYLENLGNDTLDVNEFEKASGVGIEVSASEVETIINRMLEKDDKLEEERYRAVGRLRKNLASSEALKFADGKLVADTFTAALEAKLGPKTDADLAPPPKKGGEKKKAEAPAKKENTDVLEGVSYDTLPDSVEYPPAHTNTQVTKELLTTHLDYLKSRHVDVITRFPPEPNGHLHIGHAKSMNLNFGYARKKNGICYLRFDDTNPKAEKDEYIQSIIESVRWLGHTPVEVTYSSDYFDKLYDLGEKLVEKGFGYVCECEDGLMRERRREGVECEHRNRTVEENLALFREMRDGKHAQGTMIMRMKGDMKSPNTTMRDMVAYRIVDHPHPRTGDKWKIYPSYDFTHCICDSIENITHSLCTLEFNVRRPAYEWLLHVLDMYCPPQREFARLELKGTVLSKRRLLKLVEGGYVKSWDDPRLHTLNGLRRRGFSPQAINQFCNVLSVTRNEGAAADLELLDLCCRRAMERDCNRTMVVLDPLRIVITNYPEGKSEEIEVNNHPLDESRGKHTVSFGREVFIERSDFREVDSKDYKRLAPGKEVRLRFAHNITCTNVVKDDKGEIAYLEATYDSENKGKPKGTIHWVAEPVKVEVRLYNRLFKSDNPAALDDFLADLNPNSLVTIENAYAAADIKGMKPGESVQFERQGFFTVDPDSTADKLVFNRTVALKDIYNAK